MQEALVSARHAPKRIEWCTRTDQFSAYMKGLCHLGNDHCLRTVFDPLYKYYADHEAWEVRTDGRGFDMSHNMFVFAALCLLRKGMLANLDQALARKVLLPIVMECILNGSVC